MSAGNNVCKLNRHIETVTVFETYLDYAMKVFGGSSDHPLILDSEAGIAELHSY